MPNARLESLRLYEGFWGWGMAERLGVDLTPENRSGINVRIPDKTWVGTLPKIRVIRTVIFTDLSPNPPKDGLGDSP